MSLCGAGEIFSVNKEVLVTIDVAKNIRVVHHFGTTARTRV